MLVGGKFWVASVVQAVFCADATRLVGSANWCRRASAPDGLQHGARVLLGPGELRWGMSPWGTGSSRFSQP